MAKRPVFFVRHTHDQALSPVEVVMIDFQWFPGVAKSQKQKSIDSLHDAIKKTRPTCVLEISSKSREDFGIKLSAFNLGFTHPRTNKFVSVESAFQGSKVFQASGPFPELYTRTSREAKRFFKDKELGPLVSFEFYGQSWPLRPMTLFYDWLYLNSLSKNLALAEEIMRYDSFTDIEFNPQKSVNCQAYSAALFVSLSRRGILEDVLKSKETYSSLMRKLPNWIESTEYARQHLSKQWRLL